LKCKAKLLIKDVDWSVNQHPSLKMTTEQYEKKVVELQPNSQKVKEPRGGNYGYVHINAYT
jgi:hypothetical protein